MTCSDELTAKSLLAIVEHSQDEKWLKSHHVDHQPVEPELKFYAPIVEFIQRQLVAWPKVQSHRMTALVLIIVSGIIFGYVLGCLVTKQVRKSDMAKKKQ